MRGVLDTVKRADLVLHITRCTSVCVTPRSTRDSDSCKFGRDKVASDQHASRVIQGGARKDKLKNR